MKNISLLLFVALILVVIFNLGKSTQTGETTKIDGKKYEILRVIHDTVKVPKVVKGNSLPAIIDTIRDTVPVNVDTSAILADYYTKNVYKDTIRIDTNGYVFISDTVYKNRLSARYFEAHITEKIVTNTMIVKPAATWHLYAGFDVSLDKVDFINRVGGNILLETKTNRMLGLGAGLTSKATPYISFQYYFKLK